MTGVKVVVVALALVLIAGFSLLFLRMSERRHAVSDPVAAEATVNLPAGAKVLQVAPAGPLVDVLVERPDGTWDLMHVRRSDGTVAGTLRLAPAPAAPATP